MRFIGCLQSKKRRSRHVQPKAWHLDKSKNVAWDCLNEHFDILVYIFFFFGCLGIQEKRLKKWQSDWFRMDPTVSTKILSHFGTVRRKISAGWKLSQTKNLIICYTSKFTAVITSSRPARQSHHCRPLSGQLQNAPHGFLSTDSQSRFYRK